MKSRPALAAAQQLALLAGLVCDLMTPALAANGGPAPEVPATVYFPSADGQTELVAYLYAGPGAGPWPVVVMLHGRSGPYSSNVHAGCSLVGRGTPSPCNAASLSKRHAMWGAYWVSHGYAALLVDSFGPRGRAHGYPRFSHADPDREAVNELTVRPLDAQGALAWLDQHREVASGRVLLQGWSNGASTALNTMSLQATAQPLPKTRFRGALAFYPGCGPRALIAQQVAADAPVWVFLGSEDEEVSPRRCMEVLRQSRGAAVEVTVYAGATHDFDDPGPARQAVAGNRAATANVLQRAAQLFDAVP